MSNEQKRKTSAAVRKYKPPPASEPPDYSVEVSCPLCGHRAIDMSDYPSEPWWVRLKCPNCHNIIAFQCSPQGSARN